MTLTNTLKRQVDLPVWEWCKFAPVVSAAGLCTCSDESVGGRYIYYLGSATAFYRYDTVSDGWQILSPPGTTAVTIASMRYSVYGGYRGSILEATSTSVTIPGLQGDKLIGKTIRIYKGAGKGQERVISNIAHEIVEHGLATTAGVNSLQDNQTIPKKWKINQWSGYQCRVVFGTGQSQVRKILYNDTNTLVFSDTNWQAYDSWNNTGFSATAPFALPVNAVSMYYIEKSVATVPAWTTVPDTTSRFVTLTGSIWLAVGTTLALGSVQMHYYDVLSDTWVNKTKPGGVMTTLLTYDISLERAGEISGSFTSGTCTGNGTLRNLIDTGASWEIDRWANYQLRVTNPATGETHKRRILGNTSTTMYIDKPWDSIPTNAYTYSVYGDSNAIWVAGNAQSSLYKYMIEEDMWTTGQNYDSGVVTNLSYKKNKNLAFQATTAVNANAITAVNATPTVAGTGYKVGDILNVTQAAGGKVRVSSINQANGAVLAIELYACGTGTYTPGTGKATTSLIPAAGGGTGCTIEITSIGAVAKATTAIAHNFKAGDTVIHSGATVAGWNASFTILACDSTTTFEFIPPNATAPVALASNSTVLIVDSSKAWTPGEHIGKIVTLTTVGILPTAQIRKITANTETTLTVATLTTQGVIGTSRYVIHDLNSFGKDDQYKIPSQSPDGWATNGSTSVTLEDTTKNWIPGQWIGYKLKVICGTGFDKGEIAISANSATVLTLTTPGFTPDTTTKYRIMDSYGIATGTFAATTLADSTKNWAVNQWAGKSVRLNVNAAQGPVEVLITSNTANTLTYATTTTASDANTCYTILAPAVRQIGIQAMWNYGSSKASEKGKYLYVPRGGSTVSAGTNLLDRYNICADKWDVTLLQIPQGEIEVLGSQYAYDTGDYIYWTPSGAQGTRVFRININTLNVEPSGQHPYANGAGLAGNRMEIIETEDHLKYLYLMRATGSEWWRTLLFW